MSGYIAYQRILKFINDERRMRENVFKNEPLKIDAKLNDADEALTALEWLRQAASVTALNIQSTHKQDSLL